MIYDIYKNGVFYNTIESTKEFVEKYCDAFSYTFIEKIDNKTNVENDEWKDLKLLKAQVQAASDRSDFLEDCIAEMATLVYNTEETT